jgi:hypothetical protein
MSKFAMMLFPSCLSTIVCSLGSQLKINNIMKKYFCTTQPSPKLERVSVFPTPFGAYVFLGTIDANQLKMFITGLGLERQKMAEVCSY